MAQGITKELVRQAFAEADAELSAATEEAEAANQRLAAAAARRKAVVELARSYFGVFGPDQLGDDSDQSSKDQTGDLEQAARAAGLEPGAAEVDWNQAIRSSRVPKPEPWSEPPEGLT